MKTITTILIFLAFVQATVLPLNLGLILILARAFIKQDRANIFLAATFGLLVSHLGNLPFGVESLIFLSLVELIYFWAKTPFSKNALTVIPLIGLSVLAVEVLTGAVVWPQIFWETVLIMPIYLTVRFWEERFIAPKEIKLRI